MNQTLSKVKDLSTAPQLQPKQVEPQIFFSVKQNYLYRKAMLGVKGVPKDLQEHLSQEQKLEIDSFARKVQRALNIWKQEICIARTNNLFTRFFPRTEFTKTLLGKFSNPDPKFFNVLDWKELGIDKPMIAKKLIENGYLPSNFNEL